jgi:hypothetical protein
MRATCPAHFIRLDLPNDIFSTVEFCYYPKVNLNMLMQKER